MDQERQEIQISDPRQGTLLHHLFPLSGTANGLMFFCSVCGKYWSQGIPEQMRDIHISGPRKEPHLDCIEKRLFCQCINCMETYGQMRHWWYRPYEHDQASFEKTGDRWITLKGTGPTED